MLLGPRVQPPTVLVDELNQRSLKQRATGVVEQRAAPYQSRVLFEAWRLSEHQMGPFNAPIAI
jgi:hypothetical protein